MCLLRRVHDSLCAIVMADSLSTNRTVGGAFSCGSPVMSPAIRRQCTSSRVVSDNAQHSASADESAMHLRVRVTVC